MRRMPIILSSVPVVSVGLLIATFAILRASWPPDPAQPISSQTVSYLDRLRGEQPSLVVETQHRTVDWYGRRVFDGATLAMLLLGYASIARAMWRGQRWTLVVLTAIGALGALYSAATGLYAGPILATAGFALVLFGAGLGWISQHQVEA